MPSDIPLLETTPRSAEVVRSYLEAEFFRLAQGKSRRLPSIQRLAKHLGVSLSTVNQVYKEYAIAGKVESKPGRGSYLIGRAKPANCAVRIGINGADQQLLSGKAEWYQSIHWEMVSQSANAGRSFAFFHVNIPSNLRDPEEHSRAMFQQFKEHLSEMDGAILFPGRRSKSRAVSLNAIVSLLEDAGKPCVEINQPHAAATANFVSNDYAGGAYRLGRSFLESGRRNFLAVILQPPSDGFSSSSAFASGLALGCCRDERDQCTFNTLIAPTLDQKVFLEIWTKFWRGASTKPDAICCLSDFHAKWILEFLTAENLRVPEKVSLTGGTGLNSTQLACPELTLYAPPLKDIGQAAISMLLDRITRNNESHPGIFVPPVLLGRGTTRPEENEYLESFEMATN